MVAPLGKLIVSPVLVGRGSYLESLGRSLEQVTTGHGQTLLIAGEAGIGKTRLVSEAKARAAQSGFLILEGHCFEPDHSLPYAPVVDLLRMHLAGRLSKALAADLGPIASELVNLLPELATYLPGLTSTAPLDPEQEKRRLFQALAEFLLSFATPTQPVLLILEDFHWADNTSVEFLLHLARDIQAHPTLLLVTYRTDETQPELAHVLATLERKRLATELRLVPLSLQDADAMLRALLGLQRSVHAGLLHEVYTLTEGNPFFIEEIVRSLLAKGELRTPDGGIDRTRLASLRVPRSIRESVTHRSARLRPVARQALELAAVAGRRFDFELLQLLLDCDERELLELIKELIASYLVVEESVDRFAFRHALTRQAVYEQMLARERKALHRQIAEALEHRSGAGAEVQVEDLAYHWYEAGEWVQALEHARGAAERARALHVPRAIIEQVTRALEAASHFAAAPPLDLYRMRGKAYESVGEFEAALADYEAALRLVQEAGDQRSEWQALLDLGMYWTGHDYGRAGQLFERALELARQLGDPTALGHSLNRLGNWYLNVEQPSEARRRHEQALAIFESLNDRSGIAETLDLLGVASFLSADASGCATYCGRAAALFDELNDRQLLASSLAMLADAGGAPQYDTQIPGPVAPVDAIQYGERALRITREINWRVGEAFALLCLSSALAWGGEYGRAFELAGTALAIAEEIEHQQWQTYAHWLLGTLYLDLLAPEEAQGHLEPALALAREVGSQFWLREASSAAASGAVLRGELDRAAAVLDAAIASDSAMQTMGQRHCWRARAELAMARGDVEQSLEIVERLSASALGEAGESTVPRLALLRGRALIALRRPREAESALAAGESASAAYPIRSLLWRIRVVRGKLAQTMGKREEADRLFSAAREVVDEIAASLSDAPIRERFLREATTHIPSPRPLSDLQLAKRAFGGLTRREREVAELVAAGHSNRAIADALVLSERTVEKHVAGVLSKLGLTSRTQIAAWAVKVGLARDAQ